MVDTEAGEHTHALVVHHHGEVDNQFTPRHAQIVDHVFVEIDRDGTRTRWSVAGIPAAAISHRLGSPLAWLSAGQAPTSTGAIRIAGAAPGAFGVIILSGGIASIRGIDGVQALIDPTPGAWFAVPFLFDGSGQVLFGGGMLHDPVLAGHSLFAQAVELAGASVFASNGLELGFE